MLRAKLRVAWILVALCGSCSPEHQHVPAKATAYDDSWLMDPSGAGASINQSVIFGVQRELAALGFFMRPFTAKLDDRTREAIREFQRLAALPPTGGLTKETAKKLGELVSWLHESPPGLPPYSYYESVSEGPYCDAHKSKGCAYVRARGSWLGEDLHALSTNDVVCDVGQGTCRDIWVTIGPIGNLLDIDTNAYTIATANEREIITHPRELRCVAYTLRVNRVLEQMTLLRTTTSKDDGCEYLEKREFHMHLGNGIERLAKYNEHWREALAFLTPPPGVLAPFDAGTAESRDAASR